MSKRKIMLGVAAVVVCAGAGVCFGGPVIVVEPEELNFSAVEGGDNPAAQTLYISNGGTGNLQWEITEDCSWLSAIPKKGNCVDETDEVTVSVDISGLSYGCYSCELSVIDAGAVNSPRIIRVLLYVNRIFNVPGDFSTIQSAIDASEIKGDTVLVADDIYTGNGNRDINFRGKAITVKSENGPDNCIVDCQSTETEHYRGFVFRHGESENSILDGFTITNGHGDPNGGGIICDGTSPTITNCFLSNNKAEYDGGGGIYFDDGGSPVITNCVFSNNQANFGGGIVCGWLSRALIENCVFVGNTNSGIFAGGLNTEIEIVNCMFAGNLVSGAVRCYSDNVKITNCTFSGNIAGYNGGAVSCYRGNVTIMNCTFSGNVADGRGGSLFCSYNDPIITNCILWGNEPDEIYLYESTATVTYSDIEGGWEGEGNIHKDPEFVDEVGGDYHLTWESPCVDAGDPGFVPEEGEVDIDGEPRVMGGRVDMGADEVGEKQADFTRDGRIDILDLSVLGGSWDTQEGELNWYVLCDLWEDDVIDIGDLSAFVNDWMWEAEWH